MNVELTDFFEKTLMNSNYNIKAENICTTLNESLNNKPKKISIPIKKIISCLQTIKSKMHKNDQLDFKQYLIFSIFETSMNNLKIDISKYEDQKLIIFINNKYLTKQFSDKFATELRLKKDDGNNNDIIRCSRCNMLLQTCMILDEENRNTNFFKPFELKVKKKYLINLSKILSHKLFQGNKITNSDEFVESLRVLMENLHLNITNEKDNKSKEKDSEEYDRASEVLRKIEEEMTSGKNQSKKGKEETLQNFMEVLIKVLYPI